MPNIKITDNDIDTIDISIGGRFVRSWSYFNDTERRWKMKMAREFANGITEGLLLTQSKAA